MLLLLMVGMGYLDYLVVRFERVISSSTQLELGTAAVSNRRLQGR